MTESSWVGLAAGIVLSAVIVGAYLLSISTRMRGIAENLPNAIAIPIVVGADLARATSELAKMTGDDAVRLKFNTYAALAVDATGVHVVSNASRTPGLIPAAQVTVVGFGRSLIGSRLMTSIRFAVSTDSAAIELPVVPMRRRGNPVRQLTPDEFEDLAGELAQALQGRPITKPGWPY